jgi:hypothetical protein
VFKKREKYYCLFVFKSVYTGDQNTVLAGKEERAMTCSLMLP